MTTSISDVINTFLYGSASTPSDFNTTSSIDRSNSEPFAIDIASHMQNEGRFALGSRFALVEEFFSEDYDPTFLFNLYATSDDEAVLTKEQVNLHLNGDAGFFGLVFDHKDYGGGSDAEMMEYATRV